MAVESQQEAERINGAFRKFPRELFLPDSVRSEAGLDMPLSIGYGQTNSQPTLVRKMLEWLGVQAGDQVLDVGAGSGWTSALLSYLVGTNGRVFATEKIPELRKFGEKNARAAGATGILFFETHNRLGLQSHAPYDRILVSASARELPKELVEQLKSGGKMVIPIGDGIVEATKKPSGILDTMLHPGYVFVPLV